MNKFLILIFSLLIVACVPEDSPGVGEDAYLRTPSKGRSFVVATKELRKEFVKLAQAKDERGIYAMAYSGQLVIAADSTQVLVLEISGLGLRRVRITNGPHAGFSGWVPSEHVLGPPQ